jgi:LemA protein
MISFGFLCIIIIILVLILVSGYFILIYNSLIRLENNIEKSWSNIDVLLKQRYNEVTNLLTTIKGYMKYEDTLLNQITAARTHFLHARSVHDKAEANSIMIYTMKSLFAVAENYPKLKASENFLNFQNRLSEIENMIADRREFYNDSVTLFNTRIKQIPYMFVANFLNYSKKELFLASPIEKEQVQLEYE